MDCRQSTHIKSYSETSTAISILNHVSYTHKTQLFEFRYYCCSNRCDCLIWESGGETEKIRCWTIMECGGRRENSFIGLLTNLWYWARVQLTSTQRESRQRSYNRTRCRVSGDPTPSQTIGSRVFTTKQLYNSIRDQLSIKLNCHLVVFSFILNTLKALAQRFSLNYSQPFSVLKYVHILIERWKCWINHLFP